MYERGIECVCACVKERESENKREREVERERERECGRRKDGQVRSCQGSTRQVKSIKKKSCQVTKC